MKISNYPIHELNIDIPAELVLLPLFLASEFWKRFLCLCCWRRPLFSFSHPSTDDMTQRDLIWFLEVAEDCGTCYMEKPQLTTLNYLHNFTYFYMCYLIATFLQWMYLHAKSSLFSRGLVDCTPKQNFKYLYIAYIYHCLFMWVVLSIFGKFEYLIILTWTCGPLLLKHSLI